MARWLLGLALAVDLALMVILCQPIAAPMVYEQTVKEEVAVMEQEQKEPGIHQDLREAMEAYNLQLSQDQSGLDSVDSYEAPGLNLEDYGLGADDAVGYVEIPAMDVTLPLYLGASRAHMNDGAAVLGQTSMPIGGIATNCVIAAHRGWNGKAMFRDVELLQEGDLVYLTNLWETLTYQVTGISIIWPDEVEAVAIQPSQDMVTLLTCHPYIVGCAAETGGGLPTCHSQGKNLQVFALGLSICTAVALVMTMVTENWKRRKKTNGNDISNCNQS